MPDTFYPKRLPFRKFLAQSSYTHVILLTHTHDTHMHLHAQTFALERLLRQDFLGATRCCRLLTEALRRSKGVIAEQFDFGGALASRYGA
jgi:hypothetical protein